jgi:RND family efflux transporter MFP subunit
MVVAVRAATLSAPSAGQVRTLADEGAQLPANGEAALLDATGLPEEVGAASAALVAAERHRASAETAVRQSREDSGANIATLEQTLKAAEAARDQRRAALAEARVQAATDPARLRAQLRAAEAHVRQLRSGEREQRIRQLEADLDVAQKERQVALSQFRRIQELRQRGLESDASVETARLTAQRARATESQRMEDLHLAHEGAHPEAIAEAEQQTEAARQSLAAAEGLAQQVAERKADLAAAEAEVTKARQNLERARASRLAVTHAEQEAQAAEAEARRSEAQLMDARRRLARSVVRAPFPGQVVRRRARPGETVLAGAPLLDLVDPTRLRFEASASETDLFRLRAGERVQVTVPPSTRPLPGRVAEVIQASEAARQAYAVRIDLDATAGLRPGMIGTARLLLPTGRITPSGYPVPLPLTCLRRHFPRENRAEVLIVERDRLAARGVQLTPESGERAQGGTGTVTVRSGLKDGDRVVVSDPGGLLPGSPVRAREVSFP